MKRYRSNIAGTATLVLIPLMLLTGQEATSPWLRFLLMALTFCLAVYFVYAVWTEARAAEHPPEDAPPLTKGRKQELRILKWLAPLMPLLVLACFYQAYLR